jgi:hypothetical protein
MRVALYSAIYGNYDDPRPVPDLDIPCRMFTDAPGDWRDLGWDVWSVDPVIKDSEGNLYGPTNMLRHKFWKCHPDNALPDAEISIWVDGSIEITDKNFVQFCLNHLDDNDWLTLKHPARNCIYDEATFSAQLSRYDAMALEKQAGFYRDVIGHPPQWGLPGTGIMVRRHTPAVFELGWSWWDECLHWTHQDQVSLPVLVRLGEGSHPPKMKVSFTLPWGEGWEYHEHSPKGYQ